MDGNPTKLDTGGAWCYLEINAGVIQSKSGRPDWKDPTPTGNRSIMFGCTKMDHGIYDGAIMLEGKPVAVFRMENDGVDGR
jgi:hypothetical protein